MDKKYSFKLFFNDGRTKLLGSRASTPENLKYDFDGLVSLEEYYSITDRALSSKEVVNFAKKIYNSKYNNEISKIEIINILTNEVIVTSDKQ